jgi:hypothetical protein
MNEGITITIKAVLSDQPVEFDINIPLTANDHESIADYAAAEWNDLYEDEGFGVANEKTISIDVTDWGETPEELKSLNGDFFEFCEEYKKSIYDLSVFVAAIDLGIPLTDIDEAYQGEFSSDEAFAQNLADELGCTNADDAWPKNCIDWEYAAKELMYDYCSYGGYYFRNL